jgi:hypothetical protein
LRVCLAIVSAGVIRKELFVPRFHNPTVA